MLQSHPPILPWAIGYKSGACWYSDALTWARKPGEAKLPVWHRDIELRRPLTDLQVQPFTMTHPLRWALEHTASLFCANSPPAYTSYDVLVHQLTILLAASFRPNLAVKPLPFTSSYRLLATGVFQHGFPRCSSYRGTFTSLVHAHAGRTQGRKRGRILRSAALTTNAPVTTGVNCLKLQISRKE